ncbi:hypothetical protein ACW5DW_07780 [Luteimonas sp. A482]
MTPNTVIAANMRTVASWKSALILSFHMSTFEVLGREYGGSARIACVAREQATFEAHSSLAG